MGVPPEHAMRGRGGVWFHVTPDTCCAPSLTLTQSGPTGVLWQCMGVRTGVGLCSHVKLASVSGLSTRSLSDAHA